MIPDYCRVIIAAEKSGSVTVPLRVDWVWNNPIYTIQCFLEMVATYFLTQLYGSMGSKKRYNDVVNL